MASTPGISYITYQPSADSSLDTFHNWYDNEHAPTSLALPPVTAGSRYKAGDSKSPEWLLKFEVSDLNKVSGPEDTFLPSSLNDQDVKAQVQSDCVNYELLYSRGSGPTNGKPAPFLVALRRVFVDEEGASEEYAKWFEEEHAPLLAKIPGWLRSRTFRQKVAGNGTQYYLTIHEYTHLEDMIDTMKKTKGLKTDWKDKVDSLLAEKLVREWKFDCQF